MPKGAYRGQPEINQAEPQLCLPASNPCDVALNTGKGVYRGQLNHVTSDTLNTPPAAHKAKDTRFSMADIISQADLEQLDDNGRPASHYSTRNSTRASSPHTGGRTRSEQGISAQSGQTIKIVVENNQPAAPAVDQPKPHPQQSMTKFWNNFDPEYQGKITQILPVSLVEPATKSDKPTSEIAHHAAFSYSQAREKCIRDVKRIVRDCRALNVKYTDVHFDIERDLKITRRRDCLDGLVMADKDRVYPSDVKRVCDIFESPKFFANGAGFDDMVQGDLGDCWLLAAFSILTCREQLVRNVCVIHDADIGVYGFVFYRDGEWHQCIIDDKLYLRAPSYDESGDVVLGMYGVQQRDQERSYTDMFQRGSKSLVFAQCRDENETWVPLLEKALAKAHGSFHTLVGGQTGEAIEDLTGGVTTEIYTTNILNKDEFWYNELRKIGKDFVFSAAAALYREWRPSPNTSVRDERRQGIVSSHAYAVLDTYEGHGQRLVKMRNPWGSTEWNGAWSDGSKEWNAEWFERLNHKFGDDGIFWISYEDMLKKYKYLDRTRIFGDEWHVVQQWTSVQVPWNTTDYQQTKFSIKVPDDTEAVLVLSQLDDRYFQGLQGTYNYTLQFRVQKDDEDEEEYIARSPHNYELVRSANVEVKLEKGTYSVLFKVEAIKTNRQGVEQVIRNNVWRKEKILQVGTLFDLAHQKGQNNTVIDTSKPKDVSTTTNTNSSASKDMKNDPNRDPWNACCVCGLRVYSKQADLELKVVLPSTEEEAPAPMLDRDDIAKAALEEAQANSGTNEAEEKAPEEQSEAQTGNEQQNGAAGEEQTQTTQPTEDNSNTEKPSEEVKTEETDIPNDEPKPDDNQNPISTISVPDPAPSISDSISASVSVISATEIDDLAGDKARSRRHQGQLTTHKR